MTRRIFLIAVLAFTATVNMGCQNIWSRDVNASMDQMDAPINNSDHANDKLYPIRVHGGIEP